MWKSTAFGVLICLLLTSSQVFADDVVNVQGVVNGPETSKPVKGATVTAYDEKDQIVGQAVTDASGVYRMAVPRTALHLDPAPKKGGAGGIGKLLGGLAKKTGSVLTTPGSPGLGTSSPLGGFTAASITGNLNPLKVLTNLTIANLVAKLLGAGVPRVKAEQTAGDLKAGKLTKAQAVQEIQSAGVSKETAEALVKEFGQPSDAAVSAAPPRDSPGALLLKVAAFGMEDANGVAQAYQLLPGSGKGARPAATLDLVQLREIGASPGSLIMTDTMRFLRAELLPALAHYGDSISIKVQLGLPGAKDGNVVVLARIGKGPILLLAPSEADIFQAEVVLGKEVPRGPQIVSVIAYLSDQAGRDKQREADLEKSGQWNAGKSYEFSPLHRASKNRASSSQAGRCARAAQGQGLAQFSASGFESRRPVCPGSTRSHAGWSGWVCPSRPDGTPRPFAGTAPPAVHWQTLAWGSQCLPPRRTG